MGNKIKVGITHGDINGVGPEIVLKVVGDERLTELMTPVVYSSPRVLSFYRKALNLPQTQYNQVGSAADVADDRVNLVNVTLPDDLKIEPGVASKSAGEAAFASLERAVADLRAGLIDVLVTAPINKDMIQSPTFSFPGHTEYLEASLAEPDRDKALMMMCAGGLRVALVTAHVPLAKVAAGVTRENVLAKLRLLNRSLVEDFSISTPRIAVLALNPHAGESGLLGNEESEVIVPAMDDARAEGIMCFGPYAADGFFGTGAWKSFDGVMAMYHDQGLAPFKTMAMGGGVNFTAGLPWVRTSPDHGTAFDIAGKGTADEQSLREAAYLAVDIVRSRRRREEAVSNPLKKQVADKPRKPKTADQRAPEAKIEAKPDATPQTETEE